MPRDAQRFAEHLDEPVDGEVFVAQLAPLVLGDRAQHRPRLRDDALLLSRRERRRRLDVEDRLDPRLGFLGVLAARPARAGGAEQDLAPRDGDRARDANRLGTVHGGDSP